MTTLLSMYVGMGLLLAIIALPLYFEKIPPNGLYGFRVKKTMENPDIWYPVNKYSSRWLIAAGIIMALSAVGLSFFPGISLDVYSIACLAVFTGIFAIGMASTVRYMNSLK